MAEDKPWGGNYLWNMEHPTEQCFAVNRRVEWTRLAPQNDRLAKLVLKLILAMKGKSSTRVTRSPPTISYWVLQHTPFNSSSHSSSISFDLSSALSGEEEGNASSFASSCKNFGQLTLSLQRHPSWHSPAPMKPLYFICSL